MNRYACVVLGLLIVFSLMNFGFANRGNCVSDSTIQTSKFKWGICSDSVSQGDKGSDLTCDSGLKNVCLVSGGKDVGATSLSLRDTNKNGAIDTIQAITLLATYNRKLSLARQNIPDEELPAVSCKRKDMLNLSLQDYQKYRDPIVRGFIKASKILLENHIFSARDLPYDTQLIPMSAILAVLGNNIDNLGRKKKLMQWFWCGVFGELYGSANETRYALDLPQVVNWIENNGHQPKTIYDANFSPSRLHTLRTRNSAAYKGVYALLMGDETKDWLSATKMDVSTYLSESIDIHHIFPVKWCEKNGICKDDYNCIINKTPLSSRTNRIVSGDAPSKYLVRLQKRAEVEDDEFQNILNSHVLSPEFLYNDDFIGFFNDRKKKILQRIEKAMNKTIPRGESQEEGVYVDED
jgi:hypothetical protein